VQGGFEFRLIDGVSLLFPEKSFDVVISNVVIEHVGGREQHLRHLREMCRVLSDDGYAYVALPNRWAPVEPHFHVPLLTWLPQRWRTPYIRLTRQAGVYDCFPLSFSDATDLFRRAGFSYTEHTYEAMQVMRRVEQTSGISGVLLKSPRWLFEALHPLVPTFIFRLRPLQRTR
jgi:SAM-dependent methyltransferase